ncbi:MAG: rhomboid family intramembrane serine protease [Paracoccaceae bacterium]
MFPIRDHNPSAGTPFVVYAILAANLLVFAYQWIFASAEPAASQFYYDWALFPAAVTDYGEYRGLLTSMFLHAGLLHLGGNMLFLWIFGDNLEDQMGHLPFLAFYLACGLLAGLAQVATEPHSMIPTVGASGAIAGVMGGYLLMFPRARVDIVVIFIIFFKVFTIPSVIMLGVWLAFQILGGVGSVGEAGVAYWAHVGGFAAGLALTLPLWLRRGGREFWRETEGLPPHGEAVYAPSIFPRIGRRK